MRHFFERQTPGSYHTGTTTTCGYARMLYLFSDWAWRHRSNHPKGALRLYFLSTVWSRYSQCVTAHYFSLFAAARSYSAQSHDVAFA
jgi:hypothetical protein